SYRYSVSSVLVSMFAASLIYLRFFFFLLPRPPTPTLFPYTTLFRSAPRRAGLASAAAPTPPGLRRESDGGAGARHARSRHSGFREKPARPGFHRGRLRCRARRCRGGPPHPSRSSRRSGSSGASPRDQDRAGGGAAAGSPRHRLETGRPSSDSSGKMPQSLPGHLAILSSSAPTSHPPR